MVTDSTANASIPMAASNSKDFAKKKRANRSAKLKQCKIDARREQWLSQVKNKGCKEEEDGRGGLSGSGEGSMEELEINPRGGKNGGSIYHYSDSDSPSNSPISHNGSVVSGTSFTGSSSGGGGGGSSSSSSSGGSCSASMTGEDEEGDVDDGCLDDWEAVADALDKEHHNPSSDPAAEHDIAVQTDSPPELKSGRVEDVQRAPPKCRAWKPDDAFRPETLPNLLKQHSLPMNSGRQYSCSGGSVWGCKDVVSAPSSCPICCEDLDYTDSRFRPCSCGFRLCLFCHKRILEDDGRCPGCRKEYECELVKGEATFRLARSCSMITRT